VRDNEGETEDERDENDRDRERKREGTDGPRGRRRAEESSGCRRLRAPWKQTEPITIFQLKRPSERRHLEREKAPEEGFRVGTLKTSAA